MTKHESRAHYIFSGQWATATHAPVEKYRNAGNLLTTKPTISSGLALICFLLSCSFSVNTEDDMAGAA
jgi:hypothetical protein